MRGERLLATTLYISNFTICFHVYLYLVIYAGCNTMQNINSLQPRERYIACSAEKSNPI